MPDAPVSASPWPPEGGCHCRHQLLSLPSYPAGMASTYRRSSLVNLVPVPTLGRVSGELVDQPVREEGYSNHEVIHGTEFHAPFSIVLQASCSMSSHDSLTVCFVLSYFGVEVSNNDANVMLRCCFYLRLQLLIKIALVIVVADIGRYIALDFGDVDVSSFQPHTHRSAAD